MSLTEAEAFIHRQAQVADAKQQIASLSTAIISSPEDDVILSWFIYYLIWLMTVTLPIYVSQIGFQE